MKPIKKTSIAKSKNGELYKIDISIEETADLDMFPEGVKAVFRLLKQDADENNRTQLHVLIDNHKPYGFHSHDELPENHGFREPLHVMDWKKAWDIFQIKCKEILR